MERSLSYEILPQDLTNSYVCLVDRLYFETFNVMDESRQHAQKPFEEFRSKNILVHLFDMVLTHL